MTAPWIKLSEESIRVGFRKLLRRLFRLPEGEEQEYHIKDEGETVAVLAFTRSGDVVLAEQFRPGPERVLREIPGGYLDKGETPEVAGARELLEETGYRGNVMYIGKYFADAYSNGIKHICIATNCDKVAGQELDEGERIRIVEVALEEFKEQLRSGDLTDAAGAWMALDHLGR